MQIPIRLLLAIGAIVCGFFVIQQLDVYTEGLLSPFSYLPIALVVITAILAFFHDRKGFLINRRIYHFTTSFTCSIICIISAWHFFDNMATDKAITIMQIANRYKANNVTIELKQNNRLKITKHSFLDRTIFYGSYRKYGDSLAIKSLPRITNTTQFPTTGIVRHDTVFWKNFDTMLVNKQP